MLSKAHKIQYFVDKYRWKWFNFNFVIYLRSFCVNLCMFWCTACGFFIYDKWWISVGCYEQMFWLFWISQIFWRQVTFCFCYSRISKVRIIHFSRLIKYVTWHALYEIAAKCIWFVITSSFIHRFALFFFVLVGRYRWSH